MTSSAPASLPQNPARLFVASIIAIAAMSFGRRSRTKVTSAPGVPTLPDDVAGVPIVIIDSLANNAA